MEINEAPLLQITEMDGTTLRYATVKQYVHSFKKQRRTVVVHTFVHDNLQHASRWWISACMQEGKDLATSETKSFRQRGKQTAGQQCGATPSTPVKASGVRLARGCRRSERRKH